MNKVERKKLIEGDVNRLRLELWVYVSEWSETNKQGADLKELMKLIKMRGALNSDELFKLKWELDRIAVDKPYGRLGFFIKAFSVTIMNQLCFEQGGDFYKEIDFDDYCPL